MQFLSLGSYAFKSCLVLDTAASSSTQELRLDTCPQFQRLLLQLYANWDAP